jgi:hypothetical protein
MKKKRVNNPEHWEMRSEYDFSNARPNPYAKKYSEGTNIVLIDDDLLHFFPDATSVNTALRALASIFPPRASSKKRPKKKTQRRTSTKAADTSLI